MEFEGNVCDVQFNGRSTYCMSVGTIWKSSVKSTDWCEMCVAYFVKKCSAPVAIWQGQLATANAHLHKHWIFRKFVRSTILHQFHLLKFCFCQIKELCEIFRLRPFTLWLPCPNKKNWGPIEIWHWPPGVLNDPLKKQWILRKLVRSTIFYQIGLLKFCLHHLKDLYQIYRLRLSILW